jgi:hypothetical protein
VRHAPLTLALLLLGAAALAAQKPDEKPHAVAGLELDAPQQRSRPGVVRVGAKVDAPEGAKVRIVWNVAARWDDPEAEFSHEVRDQGRSVQLVIPDCSGLVQVTAVAIVDGEPTDSRMAVTYVEMKYTPRGKAAPAKAGGPKAEQKAAPSAEEGPKVTAVYFVLDPIDDDVNLVAMIMSPGTRNKLKAAGLEPLLFPAGSPSIAKANLTKFVEDAGGTPVAIYATAEGKVRKVARLAADATAESIIQGAGND